jgi:hypothetical protein
MEAQRLSESLRDVVTAYDTYQIDWEDALLLLRGIIDMLAEREWIVYGVAADALHVSVDDWQSPCGR